MCPIPTRVNDEVIKRVEDTQSFTTAIKTLRQS